MTKYSQKADLVKDIQTTHRRLEKLISSMADEQLNRPGVVGDWSAKDVLAHLMEWERLFVHWYQCGIDRRSPDVQPMGMSKSGIDSLNQKFNDRNQHRPLQEVLVDFLNSFQDIFKLIQVIPETEMFSPGYFPWTGKWLLADYIAGNTCSHYTWAYGKIKLALSA